jgi:GntR family transcriptional regulator, hexuronate regulon transcriptional repressor
MAMPKGRPRLFHAVVDQIIQLVDQGVFPPGARLPGERELAERFSVSRVTVREAEVALQAMGRVVIKTGSGVYVCEPETNNILEIPNLSAFELTEARALFESEAATLAAPLISSEELLKLTSLVDAMAGNLSEAEHDENDREFHLTIAAATRNRAVQYVIETLWRMRSELPEVKRMHKDICKRDPASRGAEHRAGGVALRSRDQASARAAMRLHFSRLLTTMLDASEERAISQARQEAAKSRERYLISNSLGDETVPVS